MKKYTLIMTMLVLAALQAWGSPVSENSARSIAWDFINDWSGCGTQSTKPSGWEAQLVHTEVSSVDVTLNAYYIINTGNGFIIVAGDDRAQSILAYGDRDIDMTDIPDAMQFMLDSYKEQIDYLLSLCSRPPGTNGHPITCSAQLLTARHALRDVPLPP